MDMHGSNRHPNESWIRELNGGPLAVALRGEIIDKFS